ncbi:unnamed protein product, partial [Oppiella nova]
MSHVYKRAQGGTGSLTVARSSRAHMTVFNRFSTLIKGINNPYDMWISTKLDQTSYIDQCFNELITECRLS